MNLDLDLSDIPGMEVSKAQAALSHATMLFYGLPGSGKTTLAASACEVEELGPVLVLDFENSTAAVAEKWGEHPNLDIIQVRDWPKAVAILEKVCFTPHKYKTVIIDPINALIQLLQMHMMKRAETKRKLLLKPKLSPQEQRLLDSLSGVKLMENTNNSLGESTTSQADYGVIGTKTMTIVNQLAAAPFLTIFVTHADDRVNEATRQVIMRPDTPGNVGKKVIEEKPTLVGYTRKSRVKNEDGTERERVLIHFENGKVGSVPFRAKKRLGLPSTLEDPTMSTIWNIVNNAKK